MWEIFMYLYVYKINKIYNIWIVFLSSLHAFNFENGWVYWMKLIVGSVTAKILFLKIECQAM